MTKKEKEELFEICDDIYFADERDIDCVSAYHNLWERCVNLYITNLTQWRNRYEEH